jgi:predicted amidophosphoribosyltransferase
MSDRYGTYYACSNCGYDRAEAEYEYCPYCGKKMKKRETEIAEKRIGNYRVKFDGNSVTYIYDPEVKE